MGILEKFCLLSGLDYPVKGVSEDNLLSVLQGSISKTMIDYFSYADSQDLIVNKDVYKLLSKPMPFGVFKTIECVDVYLAIENSLVSLVTSKFKEVNLVEPGYSIIGYLSLFDDVLDSYFDKQILDYSKRFLVLNIILSVLIDTDNVDYNYESKCDLEGRFVLVGRDKEYIMGNLEELLTYYFENSDDEVANLDDVVINICEVLKNV